ncbi:hypothetical protein F2Q68_00039233 [Brassica cretica]|uniref:Uncharacterized protein n=1 Tax=Brassica cretica TaxID=69181 RepID=A0A8S9MNP4_BRACR|nr:hypothetical protein F2Q68_00039233 [Brassica cretica]
MKTSPNPTIEICLSPAQHRFRFKQRAPQMLGLIFRIWWLWKGMTSPSFSGFQYRAKDVVEDAYVNQMRHVVLILLVITPSKAEEADKVKEDRMKMVEIVVVAIDVYTFQVMAVAAEKVDKEAAQKASAEKTDAIALNMQMTISRKLWMP